jgi:hypothetical protein
MSCTRAEEDAMAKQKSILCLVILVVAGALSGADIPRYAALDLKQLEETWNILDRFAGQIWLGWKNYADVPFHFSYANGVQMLVGHPSPMDGYDLVPGVEVRGKKVYLDRRTEIPLEMKPPLGGGGGILPLGKDKPVVTVDLRKMSFAKSLTQEEKSFVFGKPLSDELRMSSDLQILLNIHELFHCFQKDVFKWRYGNLRFNPDAAYALYASVEGEALEKAYLEKDAGRAAELLKDFLAARNLKRKSMNEEERLQETEDDIREGTAVYAEVRILELMKAGYDPMLTKKDDPGYFAFHSADEFLENKLNMLRGAQANAFDALNKCYFYGCFQAVLLSRLFPGWQDGFFQNGLTLEQVLKDRLKVSDEDLKIIGERLQDRYPLDDMSKQTGAAIGKRDAALKTILGRKGRSYIVDFKSTKEFLKPQARGESFRIGLIQLCPEGIEQIRIREVEFNGEKTPIIADQLYYVKWIDTEAKPGEKGYTIVSSSKQGDDVYVDAVFKTRGFTLKAPKIRVKNSPARVKVQVLEKVKST